MKRTEGNVRIFPLALVLLIVAVMMGACGGGGTTTSNATTPIPAASSPGGALGPALTEDTFKALLTAEDVSRLSGDVLLLADRVDDLKAMVASDDPSRTKDMDAAYVVSFAGEQSSRRLTFDVIDYDSPSSALAHFDETVTRLGMQRMDPSIADASARVEFGAEVQAIGSKLMFLAGDRVVELESRWFDDQQPMLSLEGIEELARLVASRL